MSEMCCRQPQLHDGAAKVDKAAMWVQLHGMPQNTSIQTCLCNKRPQYVHTHTTRALAYTHFLVRRWHAER